MDQPAPALGACFCRNHVGGDDLLFYLAGWTFLRAGGPGQGWLGFADSREKCLDGPQRRLLRGRETKGAKSPARKAALVSLGGGHYLVERDPAVRAGLLSWRTDGGVGGRANFGRRCHSGEPCAHGGRLGRL